MRSHPLVTIDGRSRGGYLFAVLAVGAASVLALLIRPWLPLGRLSLVFLIAVLAVAMRTRPRPTFLAALLSAMAYNFLFTEPRFSLIIQDAGELLTVGFFLVVGLIAGSLAGWVRRQMLALRVTNEQTRVLLDLSRRLAAIADLPGVQREERSRAFDMFFTGGEADRAKQGSGLGLAICSGMIGAHGGRIEALSGPGGRGASIVIHLPLIEAPTGPEPPA